MRGLAAVRLIITTFCTLLCLQNAHAQERITRYDANITVQKNGDFIVMETLDVMAEGQSIKRGIFRDFPRFLSDEGHNIEQEVTLRSVTRNGQSEPFTTSVDDNVVRWRIGSANRLLDLGKHSYGLTYHVKNQVRYHESFDEVYWNVTGSHWPFPIERASARITFPSGVSVKAVNGYTGRYGSAEQAVKSRQSAGVVFIESTRALAPRENMTVSVSIAKGQIDPPTAQEQSALWWFKNGTLVLLSGSFMLIAAYYTRAWNRVGRDPFKGPIFPLYGPPQGYSPAAVGYIYKRTASTKLLVAAMMSLAMRKELAIDAQKKSTTLTASSSAVSEHKDEALLKSAWFAKGQKQLILSGAYSPRFTKAKRVFERHLGRAYGRVYYRPNIGYTLAGGGLSLAAIVVSLNLFSAKLSVPVIAVIVGLILLNIIFAVLMPAPTPRGQTIRTQIEGFRLYLKTAEAQRINTAKVEGRQPPLMTPQLYERFMPYAVALGVEKPWTHYFEKALPSASKDYQPTGITGSFAGSNSIIRATDKMVSQISSSAVNAMPQSSSSSGSGGGGFSGGGGGGGGGGGW